MRGSDTLFELTQGILNGIPGKGTLPPIAACAGTSTIHYDGTGSGNGATDMRAGLQEIAPMSSFLNGTQTCGITLAGMPANGQAAEGIVLALDAVSIAVNPATGGDDTACGGVAFSNAGGAQLTPATCTEAGCVAGTYTPADERDYLRVLYFGVHGGSATTARNCNSDVRKALIASYKNLFQKQATCSATGACVGKKMRHAYRRDDASGTTDVFFAAIGLDGRFGGYNKRVNKGAQQSNGFCNAGDVGADHTVQGINLGFDDSVSPAIGPNWDTKIGDSDYADLDPVRQICDDGDEVCSANNARRCVGGANDSISCEKAADCPSGTCQGFSARICLGGTNAGGACNTNTDCTGGGTCRGTNGLVQVIFPPALDKTLLYPADLCDPGSVDADSQDVPYIGYFGRCADGSPAFAAGCVIGYKSCTVSTPCNVPGGSPKTTGRSYLCTQQAFPGLQGLCFLGAPISGTECRSNNTWVRQIDHGVIVTEASVDPVNPRQILGAYFRRHMNSSGEGGTCTCTEVDATGQIGCLAGCSEACSVGYAGRGAIQPSGPALAAAVRGTLPTKPNIQAFLSTDPTTFFNRYRLSRKLFYNTIVGFGEPTFDSPGDTTGPGVSGQELAMATCAADNAKQPYYEAVYNFIELPNQTTFCQDFVEGRSCSGGLHPGDKCTADTDCPGQGLVANGTCPTTTTCTGGGDINACANNPTGIPK
jgi:hypothetical protein